MSMYVCMYISVCSQTCTNVGTHFHVKIYAYISRLVASLNRTCCCSRLASIQPQLDFFRSEETPNLLHYLLVLRCSMHML